MQRNNCRFLFCPALFFFLFFFVNFVYVFVCRFVCYLFFGLFLSCLFSLGCGWGEGVFIVLVCVRVDLNYTPQS